MRFSLPGRRKRDELSCQRAVALVGDYLDGGLPDNLRQTLERHLSACPHCREYVAQLRTTIASSAQGEPDPMTAATRQALIELYRRTVSE